MLTRKSFGCFSELLLLAACVTTPHPPDPALHLTPCTVGGVAARCGTFDVHESPASSRMLALRLVVVPASGRNESPVFAFSGGPGVPTVPGAEFAVKQVPQELRRHDAVFLDTRGVGESTPLVCPAAMKTHDHELVEGDLLPDAFVADCRREIELHADPTRYTYGYVADDVEALRKALGYGRMDLVGLSAGTREALTYAAVYPKSVRSMLLYGPLPPQNPMPLNYARDTEASFDRLFADCAADPLCAAAFPRFREETDEVMAWLGTHPPTVESDGYRVTLNRGAFGEYLRAMMYTAEQQARVPAIIHEAARGHWDAIAKSYVKYRKSWFEAVGPFLAITCPMDVRSIDRRSAAAAAAETIIGDYRVTRQIAACEQWTPGTAPPLRVTQSAAPVLIVTGDLDPVTPPRWADVLAHDLHNARVVVVKNTGHVDLNACTDGLEVAFFDSGSFANLDARCAQTAKRPPFATALP